MWLVVGTMEYVEVETVGCGLWAPQYSVRAILFLALEISREKNMAF
jgi:hypothetical protein